jgi:phospholipid-binding lipoprotein MlaA
MPSIFRSGDTEIRQLFATLALAMLALSSCASASDPLVTHDPLEPMNRGIHAFNRGVDQTLLRPVSNAVSGNGSGFMGERIGDFSDNLGKPADVLNNVLQLRLIKATENTLRFAFNVVFGLGGTFDVASAAGMPENKTDFGETLHIWGIGEGAYLEVPLFGPTTERDLLGDIVDWAIDPWDRVLQSPESYIPLGAKVASRVGDRGRYSETLDSVLYDSADSYAQTRLLYLQNRRHDLGQTADDSTFVDPYEDPYGQ